MSDGATRPGNQSPSPNEQTISKSDIVWFDDGNIILQTATKRYRVHKSVLAAHSSVFKDMFSLPQPLQGVDIFEGCLLVHLADLTDDWDEFLPLLYYMRDLRNESGQVPPYLLAAMLRLGHKYGCNRLRDQALREIRLIFPTNFDSYKSMLEKASVQESLREESVHGNEFHLLDVALDLGIQTVLPLAFFTCLKNCTTAQILDGSYTAGPARPRILRPQIRGTLIQAKEKIIMDISEQVYAWWRQGGPGFRCRDIQLCSSVINTEAVRMIGAPNITEIFTPKVRVPSELCDGCRRAAMTSIDATQRIFDNLPSYFGLPKWDELKDFEN